MQRITGSVIVIALSLALSTSASLISTTAASEQGPSSGRHVLLISVDGLHASDLAQWIRRNPGSPLAKLTARGTTYRKASAPVPTDSFPGMLALATGGTPKATGVFYDDSYDRTLYAPGSNCQGSPGTEVLYDESLDHNPDSVDSGGIDPAKLPLRKTGATCSPVYPHQFLRVNTIFNVAHDAGLRTAWSD